MEAIWTNDPVVTFGLQVCSDSGGDITIESVEPVEEVGGGFAFEAARVVQYKDPDTPTIKQFGYPPPERTEQEVFELGAKDAITACDDTEKVSEIQVALKGTDPDDGGGWKGVKLTYTAGGEEVLEYPAAIYICSATAHWAGGTTEGSPC